MSSEATPRCPWKYCTRPAGHDGDEPAPATTVEQPERLSAERLADWAAEYDKAEDCGDEQYVEAARALRAVLPTGDPSANLRIPSAVRARDVRVGDRIVIPDGVTYSTKADVVDVRMDGEIYRIVTSVYTIARLGHEVIERCSSTGER